MRGSVRMVVPLTLAALLCLAIPLTASATATAIRQRVEGPAAIPRFAVALGAAPSAMGLSLDVALAPRDPESLARFVAQVSTPGSPSYRHFLPRGAFGPRFGPSAATRRLVLGQLRASGLRPVGITPNGLLIKVVTTVAVAEPALTTTIDRFRLVDGRVGFANVSGVSVPAAIGPFVQGVFGLTDLEQLDPAGGARPIGVHRVSPLGSRVARTSGPAPCASAVSTGAATSNVLARAYGLSALYGRGLLGQGETIALFEASAYAPSDVAVYQHCYGTTAHVVARPVDGGTPVGAGSLEATPDVEDLVGLVPHATIQVYETSNYFMPNWLDEWSRIVNDDGASIISTSWLACESYEPSGFAAAENTDFEQAATQGQTVLAATGDYGSAACDQFGGSSALAIDDPASTPYATAVGGTQWASLSPRLGERAWNTAGIGAGGGGISSVWTMPSWQQGRGVLNRYSSGSPCGAGPARCRETPDVSGLAGRPYYAFYCRSGDCGFIGGWGWFYGTSYATPMWAASVALANESCSSQPPVGFLSPSLYALAESHVSPFHDVTQGGTDYTGKDHGDYPSTAGYDLATGLGTPEWTTGGPGLGLAGRLCLLDRLPALQHSTPVLTPSNGSSSAGAYLNGVSCSAVGTCTGVGTYTDNADNVQAMVTREVAGRWARASEVAAPADAAPDPTATLNGVACPSPTSCVAVGGYVDTSGHGQALVALDSAGTWAQAVEVAGPSNAGTNPTASFAGVSCTSPGNCVAVGTYVDSAGATQAMAATETTGTWAAAVELAAPSDALADPHATLRGVACSSLGNCVAVGSYDNAASQQAFVATEASGVWGLPRRVTPPANAAGAADSPAIWLNGVSCPTDGNCVAVGGYVDDVARGQGLTVTETTGRWGQGRELLLPAGASADANPTLDAVACPFAGTCVAVGGYTDGHDNAQAMVVGRAGGQWVRATLVTAPAGAASNPAAVLHGVACPELGSCVAVGAYGTAGHHGQPMWAGPAPPSITRLTPAVGSTRGGTLVRISGVNLSTVIAVRFGTSLAKLDAVIATNQIEVTAPRGAGAVYVTVTAAGGTSARVASARYTYRPPSP